MMESEVKTRKREDVLETTTYANERHGERYLVGDRLADYKSAIQQATSLRYRHGGLCLRPRNTGPSRIIPHNPG